MSQKGKQRKAQRAIKGEHRWNMSKGHFSDKDKWESKAKATDDHNKGRADNYKGQRDGVKQQKNPKEM